MNDFAEAFGAGISLELEPCETLIWSERARGLMAFGLYKPKTAGVSTS